MIGSILRGSLIGNVRVALYWGLALAFFGFYAVALTPDTSGLKQYADLMDSFGEITALFGISEGALATAEGFIGFVYLEYTLLLLSVFAVVAALSVSAGEEEQGMLDWQLSLPVSRARFLWERSLAFLIIFAGTGFAASIVAWLTTPFNDNVSLGLLPLLAGALNFLPTMMLVFAFTLLVTVVLRRRAAAAALAGVFVGVSYFLNGIGNVAGGNLGDILLRVSYFYHYRGSEVLTDGLNAPRMLLTAALAFVLLILAARAFQRRDIGI